MGNPLASLNALLEVDSCPAASWRLRCKLAGRRAFALQRFFTEDICSEFAGPLWNG